MKSSITAATPGTSSSPSLTKSPLSDADIGLMGYDQRVLVLASADPKVEMLGIQHLPSQSALAQCNSEM